MPSQLASGLTGGLPASAALARGARAEPVLARLRQGASSGWTSALWRGDQLVRSKLPTLPTGHAALDAELPGGGWPAAGLSELLWPEIGSGEIQLLAPSLRDLAGQGRELVWIAPSCYISCIPYAPNISGNGLVLSKFTWIHPASEAEAAWAAEQVLRAGCSGAVLWWSRESRPEMLRRLHLAAQEGHTPLFGLRPWACQQQSSPAPLRLSCRPSGRCELSVQIFKRRGPPMAEALHLHFAAPGVLAAPRHEAMAPAAPLPLFEESTHAVAGPASAVAAA